MSKESYLKNQEIHKKREQERMFIASVVDARNKEMDILKANGTDLSSSIYDELKSYGLNPKSIICECIEDLVYDLYLERKAYKKEERYFDLEDTYNSHYVNTREFVEGLTVKQMTDSLDSIVKDLELSSRSELLYELANTMIIRHGEDDEKLLVYKK